MPRLLPVWIAVSALAAGLIYLSTRPKENPDSIAAFQIVVLPRPIGIDRPFSVMKVDVRNGQSWKYVGIVLSTNLFPNLSESISAEGWQKIDDLTNSLKDAFSNAGTRN